MPMTTTGDISLRTAGYISKKLLERAQPLLCLSRFGQPKPLPKNVGKTMKFREYEHLPNQPKALTEGVTPASSKPTYRDVITEINQYGDWIELTDVLADTHEDPLIPEFTDILGEQSAIMLERVIAGVLLAGTNVHFSGNTGGVIATNRSGVNQPLTLAVQRRVMRGLRRQNAQRITSVVGASPNFNTSPVPPCFIGVAHTDLEQDIREMPGFIPTEKYGSYKPMDGEVGSVEGVRYILTTVLEPWLDEGAAPVAGASVESNEGACADVYPVLYFAKNAYGTIPFAKAGRNGASPVTPMVLNPNVPRGGDPLGQRGSISWKAYQAAVILYDMYMARVECAATKY